tara:strand:+ start:61 stop:450 length:390 start_codon:yes stop_codon:yes gene_type:complete
MLTENQANLLANLFKSYRSDRNLSQKKFADLAGIGSTHYNMIETGRALKLQHQTLVRMADNLQLKQEQKDQVLRSAGFIPTSEIIEPVTADELELLQNLRSMGAEYAELIYGMVKGSILLHPPKSNPPE